MLCGTCVISRNTAFVPIIQRLTVDERTRLPYQTPLFLLPLPLTHPTSDRSLASIFLLFTLSHLLQCPIIKDVTVMGHTPSQATHPCLVHCGKQEGDKVTTLVSETLRVEYSPVWSENERSSYKDVYFQTQASEYI